MAVHVNKNLTFRGLVWMISALSFMPFESRAQFPEKLKDGWKTYLSGDSSAFLKVNFLSQIWVRYNQNNPGSLINNEPEKYTFDVGLRRTRIVLSGQLTDRVSFFVQFGQNNFGYLAAKKTGAFFHDVTGEYAVVKKKFNIGFGLNGWYGLSRYSNTAASTILALDPPIFQETTNDINDQFVRRLGVYAKGKLGRFDYRVSVSKPFVTQTATSSFDPLGANSSYSPMIPQQAYQTYFMYQFLDKENNFGPGTVGTYLGRKKVFNIGGGFVYQGNAMWSKIESDTAYHAIKLWSLDVFYDSPVGTRGSSLSVYGGYFNYDFGKGYLRNVAPMNPANGTKNGSLNGPGNGAPLVGTGSTVYVQSGYKLRKDLLGESGTLQFYSAVQYSRYDRLNDPMVLVDCGVNWLIYGHNSKFTLNYQSRPVFKTTDQTMMGRRGEWVLQYQIAF